MTRTIECRKRVADHPHDEARLAQLLLLGRSRARRCGAPCACPRRDLGDAERPEVVLARAGAPRRRASRRGRARAVTHHATPREEQRRHRPGDEPVAVLARDARRTAPRTPRAPRRTSRTTIPGPASALSERSSASASGSSPSRVEAHDLPERVDAGVGAAGADGLDLAPQHGRAARPRAAPAPCRSPGCRAKPANGAPS